MNINRNEYDSTAITQDYELKKLAQLYNFGTEKHPNKIAIKQGRRMVSFGQLEYASTALANNLIRSGIKRNDVIVVIAEKQLEIGIIAPSIWKSSSIYVPIDAELPEEKLKSIIHSLQPTLIFSTRKWHEKRGHLNFKCPIFFFEDVLKFIHAPKAVLMNVEDNLDSDTAYIIFTSGSTGSPKGVMISHGNLLSYFMNHNEIFNFTSKSYCFSISPFHFDVSIEDTFLPLSRGSSVYLYKGLPMASLILKILEEEKITHAIMVSTILTILTKIKEKVATANLSSLSLLMTGAEVCSVDVINFWKNKFPDLRVYNAYGPTETTIVSHCYEIKKTKNKSKEIYPIGKSLRNVTSLLINANKEIFHQKNIKGELLIGGTQVMKGYWDDSELTKNRIIEFNGLQYYRTGDICFLDDDDNYHFVGRSDKEIKLNGRRVNLLEIHEILIAQENVENAIVDIVQTEVDQKISVILICTKEVSLAWLENVFNNLDKYLPQYLIPTFICATTENQVSSTGKNNEKYYTSLFKDKIKQSKKYHKYYILTNGCFRAI